MALAGASASALPPLSNVALFEHVNLNLPRAQLPLARALFLSRGLGLLEDPRPRAWGKHERLLWADAGLQQLHLPLVEEGNAERDSAPQALRGCLGLACACAADVRAVRARLEALAREVSFAAPPADLAVGGEAVATDDRDEDAAFAFSCPFGGRYVVFALPRRLGLPAPRFMGGEDEARGHPAPDEGAPADVPRPLGFAWLRLDIPRGAARALASFWGDVLGARVALDAAAGAVRVEVADGVDAGAGLARQHLLFREVDGPLRAWDGHHLCLYLRDFEGAFRRCEARGLLYDPGRFADRGGSWALACEHQQFRVLHVPPEGAGGYAALGLLQALPAAGSLAMPPPPPPPPPVLENGFSLRELNLASSEADRAAFDEVARLRVAVWRGEGELDAGLTAAGEWRDEEDASSARHWVAVDGAGAIAAAARLTLHAEETPSMPRDLAVWRNAGLPLRWPVADLGRLVVRADSRRRGLAAALGAARVRAAAAAGARSVVATCSVAAARVLTRLGFFDTGARVSFADRPGRSFLALQLNVGCAPPPPVYTLELELRSLQHPSFPAAVSLRAGTDGAGSDPLRR